MLKLTVANKLYLKYKKYIRPRVSIRGAYDGKIYYGIDQGTTSTRALFTITEEKV